MPAPRIGLSGVGRLGLSLYEVLAQRELARMQAAAAAETARQEHFKEGIQLGTEDRANAKQRLDEQIATDAAAKTAWEHGHPKGELVSNSIGADGKPAAVLLNPYSGGAIGSPVSTYVKPPDPKYSLHAGTGADGQPEDQILDENTGTITTSPGHTPAKPVPPHDPPETFSVHPATDEDGNPVLVSFGNRGGRASLLPGLTPPVTTRPITVDDKGNLADYETTKFANREMAKYESQLRPRDLALMSEATNVSEALRMAGMSEAGKNYLTGARLFIEAYARDKSGAAISATEWDTFKHEVLPGINDSPERIATKRQYRDLQEDLLATNAGPAFTGKYGYKYVPHTRQTTAMVKGADGTYAPAPAPGTTAAPRPTPARGAAPAPTRRTPTPQAPMASHTAGQAPAPGAIDGRYVRDPKTGALVLQAN